MPFTVDAAISYFTRKMQQHVFSRILWIVSISNQEI